ncbi:hypothetical protein [Pedobacter sp. GR22-6]|uniref:hypothetical protein n=1 Tax=Pedobacter sp. GR22-6 TaxID=3127957 RepID=UPI00307D87EF
MDNTRKIENQEQDQNLGLDADHSSEAGDFKATLNNDNDMISGNPDGENDSKDDEVRNSPLDDK